MVNVPLEVLIRRAHHLEEFQLTGAPSWVKSARFDVTAKAPDNSPGVKLESRRGFVEVSVIERVEQPSPD